MISRLSLAALLGAAAIPTAYAQQGSTAAQPTGSPASWLTDADDPRSALRARQEGTTGFHVEIDAMGRVTDCAVTASSGAAALDNMTCVLMRRRGTFRPATDAAGNAVAGAWDSRFRWKLPHDR